MGLDSGLVNLNIGDEFDDSEGHFVGFQLGMGRFYCTETKARLGFLCHEHVFTESRPVPLRRISIGSDWSFFHLVLSTPPG